MGYRKSSALKSEVLLVLNLFLFSGFEIEISCYEIYKFILFCLYVSPPRSWTKLYMKVRYMVSQFFIPEINLQNLMKFVTWRDMVASTKQN